MFNNSDIKTGEVTGVMNLKSKEEMNYIGLEEYEDLKSEGEQDFFRSKLDEYVKMKCAICHI